MVSSRDQAKVTNLGSNLLLSSCAGRSCSGSWRGVCKSLCFRLPHLRCRRCEAKAIRAIIRGAGTTGLNLQEA